MERFLHVVADIYTAVKFLSEAVETSSVKTVFCSLCTALLQNWMSHVYEIWVRRNLETSHRMKTAGTVTEGLPYTLYDSVHVANERRI